MWLFLYIDGSIHFCRFGSISTELDYWDGSTPRACPALSSLRNPYYHQHHHDHQWTDFYVHPYLNVTLVSRPDQTCMPHYVEEISHDLSTVSHRDPWQCRAEPTGWLVIGFLVMRSWAPAQRYACRVLLSSLGPVTASTRAPLWFGHCFVVVWFRAPSALWWRRPGHDQH